MEPGQYYVQVLGQDQGPYDLAQLRWMAQTGHIRGTTLARRADTEYFPVSELPGVFSDKEWLVALLLSLLIGGLAIDRFYLGYVGLGVVKLLTCGGFGIWALIDIILIAMNRLPDIDGLPLRK